MSSKATAALMRLKEMDKKYKLKYEDHKEIYSSDNTDNDNLPEETDYKNSIVISLPTEQREISKPTLNIKIPDTYTEEIESQSSASLNVSPMLTVSIIDKTSTRTPRVESKSVSELQENFDNGESIAEILYESNHSSKTLVTQDTINSHSQPVSLASTVKSSSTNNNRLKTLYFPVAENKFSNYSDDSFESYSSDTENKNSDIAESKNSTCTVQQDFEPQIVSQKSNIQESKIYTSTIRRSSETEEFSVILNEESRISMSKHSKINDNDKKNEKSSSSIGITVSPLVKSEQNTETAEKVDLSSKSFGSLQILKKHKRKSKNSEAVGRMPDANKTKSSSRHSSSQISHRKTENSMGLKSKQPEIGEKIVEKVPHSSEIRVTKNSSTVSKQKMFDRKKYCENSKLYKETENYKINRKIGGSAVFCKFDEKNLEQKDIELERLRSRMRHLRLEQERQLMLYYMRYFNEDRKRLMVWPTQFYCSGNPEVSDIKPLEFPNVANFVKPGTICIIYFYFIRQLV